MATHLKLSFATKTPPQWERFIEEYPDQVQPDKISNREVVMTPLKYRLMCAVQRDINTVCRYKHDEAGNDHWKLIHDFPYEGDCEDFALTKRAMLLEAGFSYYSLWPMICKLDTLDHMVLIVHSDICDYILDQGGGAPVMRLVNKVPHIWRVAFNGWSWRLASI